MTEVYLDNSASTHPLSAVADAVHGAMVQGYGNPSSQHARGRAARAAVDEARDLVASFFRTEAEQVIFTSGATEANDAVLRWAFADPDVHLITTRADHPSLRGIFGRAPHRIVELPLDRDGIISQGAAMKAFQHVDRALVAISWVNGETGVVQPVAELSALAQAAGKHVLIDATQASGRLPAEAFGLDCTYMTASAHKMNGPQGVGCLIAERGAPLPDMAQGGGQEEGRRSGTENVPGIVGFGVACRERGATLGEDLPRLARLRDLLEARLAERMPGIWFNGQGSPRAATNSSITFPGVDGMALVARLDAAGVRCSQVSACSSGRPEPSRTLLAMGLSEAQAFATVRFSISVMNTRSEVEAAADIIANEALALRRLLGEVA
jgi:cysteine desulfurase